MLRVLLALSLAGPATAGEAELRRLVHQDCGSCHGLTLRLDTRSKVDRGYEGSHRRISRGSTTVS